MQSLSRDGIPSRLNHVPIPGSNWRHHLFQKLLICEGKLPKLKRCVWGLTLHLYQWSLTSLKHVDHVVATGKQEAAISLNIISCMSIYPTLPPPSFLLLLLLFVMPDVWSQKSSFPNTSVKKPKDGESWSPWIKWGIRLCAVQRGCCALGVSPTSTLGRRRQTMMKEGEEESKKCCLCNWPASLKTV